MRTLVINQGLTGNLPVIFSQEKTNLSNILEMVGYADKYYCSRARIVIVIFSVFPLSSHLPGSSLPPEAASFSPLALGVKLSQSIPAFSYWNFQFEQSEPGYIQFSFLIPRGSSIGKNGIGIKQTQHSG